MVLCVAAAYELIFFYFSSAEMMLRRAVEHVANNASFHIPVEPAITALKTAKSVLQWMLQEENRQIVSEFEDMMTTKLRECLGGADHDMQSFRIKRIELCRTYHHFRIPEAFTTTWHAFLTQVKCRSLPSFYQEVTDHTFEEILTSTIYIYIYIYTSRNGIGS